jgi:hypothetical protein
MVAGRAPRNSTVVAAALLAGILVCTGCVSGGSSESGEPRGSTGSTVPSNSAATSDGLVVSEPGFRIDIALPGDRWREAGRKFRDTYIELVLRDKENRANVVAASVNSKSKWFSEYADIDAWVEGTVIPNRLRTFSEGNTFSGGSRYETATLTLASGQTVPARLYDLSIAGNRRIIGFAYWQTGTDADLIWHWVSVSNFGKFAPIAEDMAQLLSHWSTAQ